MSYTPGSSVCCGNDNPEGALGAPEYDPSSGSGLFVSLGNGGSIILAFTDNVVIDSDGPDLMVIEVGDEEYGLIAHNSAELITEAARGLPGHPQL